MNIIQGSNVDLIYPFPSSELSRAYGWNHCYRTMTETDDTPKTPEEFLPFMAEMIKISPSWGIIDKHSITNPHAEAPLVGIGIFEPVLTPGSLTIHNGLFHVATARKAWRTGLVDEAASMVLAEIFALPSINRVSGFILESNFPAKSFARRMGFKYEGLVEDAVTKSGKPANMVLFGLTRKKYQGDLCKHQPAQQLDLGVESEEPLEVLPQLSLETKDQQ